MTALDGFLAGVALTLAVVGLLLVRFGAWEPLDDPECEHDDQPGGCTAPSRHGWVGRHRVRWRVVFRCAGCDCRWARGWLLSVLEWARPGMDEREREDRGVAS